MFRVVPRATLLFPAPHEKKHLHIIISEPRDPPGNVVMVPVFSTSRRHDATCILTPDDHDFLVHESFVGYACCRIEPAEKLTKGVNDGLFADRGLIGTDPFARILSGLRDSPHTKPFVWDYVKK